MVSQKTLISTPPYIVVLSGLTLSGKTTLGQGLAEALGAKALDVDAARREIFPEKGWFGADREFEIMLESYDHNHKLAKDALKKGQSVILSGTYSRPVYREKFRALQIQTGAKVLFICLSIPDDVALERLEKRKKENSPSNIKTMEAYNEQKNRFKGIEYENLLNINSDRPVTELVCEVANELRSRQIIADLG